MTNPAISKVDPSDFYATGCWKLKFFRNNMPER